MAKRKRRRSRATSAGEGLPVEGEKRRVAAKSETGGTRAAFDASQKAIAKRRTIIGALGFIPLAATLIPCGQAGPLDVVCQLDRQWWLLIWAAIFGSFLGLTIRLILERRRYARGTWRQRSA